METNIEKSFIRSICESSIGNISSDLSELLLDQVIENEALKSIPIVSTIINLGKGVVQVREAIFVKKIIKFLLEIEKVPINKREKFIKENFETSKNQTELGGKLIEILDHLDDSFKANYIGKIFKKYLLEEITYEEFNRACRIIDKALIPDLQHLVSFNEHKERNWDIPWLILVEFESLGLLRMIPPIGEATLKDHEMYQPKFFTMTPLGKFFLELEIL